MNSIKCYALPRRFQRKQTMLDQHQTRIVCVFQKVYCHLVARHVSRSICSIVGTKTVCQVQDKEMDWECWGGLKQTSSIVDLEQGKLHMLSSNRVGTYRAAVEHGADVGVVIVRHLLVVGAQEAHGLVVVVLVLVVPGHRLVAVVGDVLPAGGAQQPQEGHLDHADGVALRVHVGELRAEEGRSG